MAIRTARLQGKIWTNTDVAPTIAVIFNNQPVYSGPAPYAVSPVNVNLYYHELETLAEWTFDSDVDGSIPVSIIINNGTGFIRTVLMNLCGQTWLHPTAKSLISVTQMLDDFDNLTDQEFEDKHGVTKAFGRDIPPETNLTTEENFAVPNKIVTSFSDGKENVLLDREEVECIVTPYMRNQWCYQVPSGSELTFDIEVNPAIL